MIQTAMLYTSCSGQRRVRILNLSLSTSGQMGELYRSCDLDTIMNFFGKQGKFCKIYFDVIILMLIFYYDFFI